VVECLPSKHKALSSVPNTAKIIIIIIDNSSVRWDSKVCAIKKVKEGTYITKTKLAFGGGEAQRKWHVVKH
jgi:hypothetical protein